MLNLLDHHLVAPAFAVLAQLPVTELGALMLRVSLGALFIIHLVWKFAVCDGGFRSWWSNFEKNGYPRIVPYYVVSAEILGAVCLIPGIHTRWVCLYALPLMIGAAHFWQISNGFFFTGGGSELPIVWALMLLVQSLLGDGAFAVGPVVQCDPAKGQDARACRRFEVTC